MVDQTARLARQSTVGRQRYRIGIFAPHERIARDFTRQLDGVRISGDSPGIVATRKFKSRQDCPRARVPRVLVQMRG